MGPRDRDAAFLMGIMVAVILAAFCSGVWLKGYVSDKYVPYSCYTGSPCIMRP